MNNRFIEIEIWDNWKWRYLKYLRYAEWDIGWDRRPKNECSTGKFIFSIIYYDGYHILLRLHRFYIGAWHL